MKEGTIEMSKKIKIMSNKKTVCIDGTTGQLSHFILKKLLLESDEYDVYGMIRYSSTFNTERIDDLLNHPNLHLQYGDLTDTNSVNNFISKVQPDIYFHLGACSHVRNSEEIAEYVMDVNATGTLRCLEALRLYCKKDTHFLMAATSEQFGTSPPVQTLDTPFKPCSIYGIAKLASYWTTSHYRTAFNMKCSNILSFNFESNLRNERFISTKLIKAACRIKLELQDKIYLGNLDACRTWQHCQDVANAYLLVATSGKADDYIVSGEEMKSVKEFGEIVFDKLGLNFYDHVEFDKRLLRAQEVPALLGDSSKIEKLGWIRKYTFSSMIDEMIEYNMKIIQQEQSIKEYLKNQNHE